MLLIRSLQMIFEGGKLNGASDGPRTHDLLHGKQMLYQLSYTRVREPGSIAERIAFGKRFLVLEIVHHHSLAVGFEDFFHKLHVQRVILVGILRGLVLKHEVQRHLIGLIDHIPVTGCHFATMIVEHARAGLQIFFRAGEQLLGSIRHIRLGPKNNHVRKHEDNVNQ